MFAKLEAILLTVFFWLKIFRNDSGSNAHKWLLHINLTW
jgi:hypothetical protein